MNAPNPRAVVARFFDELWNARELAVADAIIAPDCVTHQLRSAPGPIASAVRDAEAIKDHVAEWLAAFPDIRFDVEEQAVCDDLVVSRCAMSGTHEGTWLGLAPTHRRIVLRMAVTHRVRAGRIVEDWVLVDWYGALEQLGVLPPVRELIARR